MRVRFQLGEISEPSLHKNFYIIEADKAPKFVVIKKEDYERKLKDCISELKVKTIDKNPTENLIKEIEKLSKKYPQHKSLLQKTPLYPGIPPLKVKIKLHKEGMPFRPIVNRKNSPVYFLEKYIAKLLKPLINSSTHITDSSLKLLEILKVIKLAPTSKFYSLDVKALYPSIPINIVHKLIVKKCQEDPILTKDVEMVNDALKLIFNANHFTINGNIYLQTDGAPMGSGLAPTLGEILLQEMENNIINNEILIPRLYKRYVDDIFIIWDFTEISLNKFINKFNQTYPNIELTEEKEKDRTIAFLDILIHRNSNNTILWTEPYHKPSAPLQIIPANSNIPNQYKFNAIAPHITRAYTHSTFSISVHKELNLIRNNMKSQGYNYIYFEKLHKNIKDKIESNHKKAEIAPNKYIGSVQFHKSFINIKRILAENKYRLTFKTLNLRKLFKPNKIDYSDSAGVYIIPIEAKDSVKVYVGQTKRSLKTRLKEHKRSLNSPYNNTALKEFILNNPDVKPLWEKARIISKPNSISKLKIKEKIEIIKNGDKCININHGLEFAKLWQPALRHVKNRSEKFVADTI